jgi:hypothetical protein
MRYVITSGALHRWIKAPIRSGEAIGKASQEQSGHDDLLPAYLVREPAEEDKERHSE